MYKPHLHISTTHVCVGLQAFFRLGLDVNHCTEKKEVLEKFLQLLFILFAIKESFGAQKYAEHQMSL